MAIEKVRYNGVYMDHLHAILGPEDPTDMDTPLCHWQSSMVRGVTVTKRTYIQ